MEPTPYTFAIQKLKAERHAFFTAQVDQDHALVAAMQHLKDHYGFIGENCFTSFSSVPDMKSLIDSHNLPILSEQPLAPEGHFIGTWHGGQATEISYRNSSQESRFAYIITDVDIDDFCQTALVTSKALNHEQFLRLLHAVTGRDTWHGEREDSPFIPIPKLRAKLLSAAETDRSAWQRFALAYNQPTQNALLSADPEAIFAQEEAMFRNWDEKGEIGNFDAVLATAQANLEKDLPAIRHIAARLNEIIRTL